MILGDWLDSWHWYWAEWKSQKNCVLCRSILILAHFDSLTIRLVRVPCGAEEEWSGQNTFIHASLMSQLRGWKCKKMGSLSNEAKRCTGWTSCIWIEVRALHWMFFILLQFDRVVGTTMHWLQPAKADSLTADQVCSARRSKPLKVVHQASYLSNLLK